MIQVQTTITRGLLAPALVLLAACSGTSNSAGDASEGGSESSMAQPVAQPDAGSSAAGSGRQDPQGGTRQEMIVAKAVENAREALGQRRYQDALAEALVALEFDPTNVEARNITDRVQEVMGEGVENISTNFQNEILKNRFQAERERFRARQEIQMGEALWEQRRYGAAEERFQNAQRILSFSVHTRRDDPLLMEVERRLSELDEARTEALRNDLNAQALASQQELDRQLRDQRIAREAKVTRMLTEANQQFQLGDYARSVTLCDQALDADPTNEAAQQLRDLADQARHAGAIDAARQKFKTEWQRAFDDLRYSDQPQTEVIEFDLDRWAKVLERTVDEGAAPDNLESPETRAVLGKLNETELEHRFASARVGDWAQWYSNLTEITFYVSPDVADDETTTLTEFALPRMSVARALDVIRDKTGVAWTVRHGVVHLVPPEEAGGPAFLHYYDVRDLITGVQDKPGPDLKLKVPGDDAGLFGLEPEEPMPPVVDDAQLEDLIRNSVATEAWDDTATLNFQNGVIHVNASAEIHKDVAALLNGLRRHVGIQVDVEARFLKVEDSFLEDIGVDFRGLGNQAAEGIAGRGLELNNRSNVRLDDFGQTQQLNPAAPGTIGTGAEPGFFFDDGQDGDLIGRTENLFDNALGATAGEQGLTNAGGLALQYAFLDDTEVEVVLRAVAKQERSEQIEAPRLTVFNNTRSSMSVLRNISYIRDFEVEIAQAAAVANPVVDVVREGVALDVRPVVDADLRFITMELRPTVMSLQLPIPTFTTTLGVGQPISIQLPRVTLQRVRTTVTMPDGGTMMLGGMKLSEKTMQTSGVPILKDLPLLSFFFSRRGQYFQNRKILILLRAKIILMDEYVPELVAGR